MKICFVGQHNLSVLVPRYQDRTVGGEPVQQTLLARALARRGHDVSMVSADLGQADAMECGGIRVFKSFRPESGVPVLRFVHPRWTGLWSALRRADADLYYTSCAGMEVGLLALFCRRFGKRFVFRSASDSDCDSSRVLVRYARDRWLYGYGLRRADAILVQSTSQAETLKRSYGLASRVAGMLVEPPLMAPAQDLDVLWVGNIRRVKRPDRVL
ncbi:MAG TPA: glycosyltransferase family 4 protein, partial [Burkholderiales bacterium]|nr:glycosyltransferase family 4 protein [Burkholderiales bacterium]